MNRSPPRLFIAGPRKSSGKTTVSIGLAAAFTRMGLGVAPFKKGPDFIDPAWLAAASGRPCRNLDFFMLGPEVMRRTFRQFASGAQLALIESNMGYFDGLDPAGSDCGAALAEMLHAPVVLVVNCQGLGRSIAPLVSGHLSFPGGERIAGVILNNVASSRQEHKIVAAVKNYCPTPILGVIPRHPGMSISERHLGLVPLHEDAAVAEKIAGLADHVERYADLPALLEIARKAESCPGWEIPLPPTPAPLTGGPTIAYAWDAAFHFYYAANLEALAAQGMRLIPFSPLADADLPAGVDGVYIGGGFPEVFMERLTQNRPLMERMRRLVREGMPVYAECGGLMFLSESLSWRGSTVPMSGILPCAVEMCDRPQGFGYMVVEGSGAAPWPAVGERIHCHEFHHSRVTSTGEGVSFAYRVRRGTGIDGRQDGMVKGAVFAAYAHVHADGAPGWADFLRIFFSRGGGKIPFQT